MTLGSNCSAYSSIGKRKTPRRLRPSLCVGAMRPINQGARHVLASQNPLHLRRVPSHDDVGKEAERIGHSLHLLLAPGLLGSDAVDVDRALQSIGGLTPVQDAQEFPSKDGIYKIVAQRRWCAEADRPGRRHHTENRHARSHRSGGARSPDC